MRSRHALAAAVLVLLAPAALAASISVGSPAGAPGDTVNVIVTLNNDSAVTALQFDLSFETSKLTSGTPTEALATDHDLDFNLVQPGRLRVLVLSNTLAALPSGTLLTIPFTIAGGLVDGNASLTLSDVELVNAQAVIIAGVGNMGGMVTIRTGPSCTPGDLNGSGSVSTADVTLARRAFLELDAITPQYLCGDVSVFTIVGTCGQRRLCAPNPPPAPAASPITNADITIIRRLFLDIDVINCAACAPQSTPLARVPGDIAPRGQGDGRLDIADVVLALRSSVGLESSLADVILADVAPVRREGGQAFGDGNGLVDIGDVVLLLRSAVGLESLVWPERQLDVNLAAAQDRIAFGLAVAGWPSYATIVGMTSTECPASDSVVESGTDRWGIVCVTDPQVYRSAGVLATVQYRGPRVDAGRLSIRGQVVAPDMTESNGVLTLEAR